MPRKRHRRGAPHTNWYNLIQGSGVRFFLPDGFALVGLLLAFGLLVLLLTTVSPTAFSAGVDRYPPSLIFRGFYGLEQNVHGSYRWAKPAASLTFLATAPADYHIVLELSDAAGAVPREVKVFVSGQQIGTATPGTGPQQYHFPLALSPDAWARLTNRTITLELITPEFVAPGDQRLLGPLLSKIAVTSTSRDTATLFIPGAGIFAVLLVVYGCVRLLGARVRHGMIVCGSVLAGFVAVACKESSLALWLVYQPLAYPMLYGGIAVTSVLLALLARVALHTAQPTDTPGRHSPSSILADQNFWSRASLPVVPVLGLASVLRLWKLDLPNLWYDEGATISFARLPWRTVLGLHGQYEPHPPLYYSLVKLAELVLPVVIAGRVVSAAAGILTVLILYTLTVRLLDRRAGLIAATTLALAPLHIWFSREARMYAPVVLWLACVALALIGFMQASSRRARFSWATFYGVAALLAIYTVYSAVYTLVALGVLLVVMTWKLRGAVLPVWLATALAAGLFLPWVPQVLSSVGEVGDRSGMLGPSPAGLAEILLAATGLGGIGTRGEIFYPGLWNTYAGWHILFLGVVLLTVALGLAALWRRSPIALLMVGLLVGGTITIAIITSTYSAGFAPRTILPIVLGWVVIVGAASLIRRPRWLQVVAQVGLVGCLVLSGLELQTMVAGAERQHYREAVVDGIAVTKFGQPLIAMGVMTSFYDAYAPGLHYFERSYIDQLTTDRSQPVALWLTYGDEPWNVSEVLARLDTLGFARISQQVFGSETVLALFMRREQQAGTIIPVPGAFASEHGVPTPWAVTTSGVAVRGFGSAAILDLDHTDGPVPRASLSFPAQPSRLYIAQVSLAEALRAGHSLVTIACVQGDGTTTKIESAVVHNSTDWQTVRTAIWCSPEVQAVRVTLENRGSGRVSFREVQMRFIDVPSP